jgi:2'-5' RNA ligase
MGSLTAAADGSHTSGAMIALVPTPGDAERLAIEGGEAADQLHLTLRYLGKGADFDEGARAAIVDSVRMLAEGMPPITSKIFGAAHWNGNGDEPSWVWSVGDDPEYGQSLDAAHGMADEALLMAAMDVELPTPHTPWVAHVCAAYSAELDLIIALEERLGPVTFDRVRVAFAGDHTDIPLDAGVTAAAGPLRRQPTELELASRVDFAQMD